jgi:DNA-binding transcriptional LysR family regulator
MIVRRTLPIGPLSSRSEPPFRDCDHPADHMNPLHLRVFLEVARLRSLAAAADALGYTASAVSRHIALLEQSTGGALFVRDPRGLQLTAAGERLLPHAQAIIERLDSARADMSLLREGYRDTIRLVASRAVLMRFLAMALDRFRTTDPDVGIVFTLADDGPAQELVLNGTADVAIATDVAAAAAAGGGDESPVIVTPLLEDPLVCALNARHRLAAEQVIDLADVAAEMWAVALPRRSATQRLHDAVDRLGLKLGHEYVVDDYHAMLGLVAADLAVACVPGISLAQPDPRVVVRPFVEPMVRHVAAVSGRASFEREPHQRLLDALRAASDEQRRWLAELTTARPG